jgi:hypothetical protein
MVEEVRTGACGAAADSHQGHEVGSQRITRGKAGRLKRKPGDPRTGEVVTSLRRRGEKSVVIRAGTPILRAAGAT